MVAGTPPRVEARTKGTNFRAFTGSLARLHGDDAVSQTLAACPAELRAGTQALAFHALRHLGAAEAARVGAFVHTSSVSAFSHLVTDVLDETVPQRGGESWMTPLAHRQFYPQELEALLHYNGFTITEQYGDFFHAPPAKDSATLLLHCKARKR